MIYFDLDGVIRDIHRSAFGFGAENQHLWDYRNGNGEDIYDIINKDLSILLKSCPTPLYQVIQKINKINIITCQPKHWRANTISWEDRYFPKSDVRLIFVNHPEEKQNFLGKKDVLIEDYPLFKDYSRIALVEYPYNKNVAGEMFRIKSAQDLCAVLINNN